MSHFFGHIYKGFRVAFVFIAIVSVSSATYGQESDSTIRYKFKGILINQPQVNMSCGILAVATVARFVVISGDTEFEPGDTVSVLYRCPGSLPNDHFKPGAAYEISTCRGLKFKFGWTILGGPLHNDKSRWLWETSSTRGTD